MEWLEKRLLALNGLRTRVVTYTSNFRSWRDANRSSLLYPKAAWLPTIFTGSVALFSLWTAVAAQRATVIQNEPSMFLVGAKSTLNGHDTDGVPDMDTNVVIKNSGNTQARNLQFTSVGWYVFVSKEDRLVSPYVGEREISENVSIDSDYQASAPTDVLDKDQPTVQNFPGFPFRHDEPVGSTDFLYIRADYDDRFTYPFDTHHTSEFCLQPPTNGKELKELSWMRTPLGGCKKGLADAMKAQPAGPRKANQ